MKFASPRGTSYLYRQVSASPASSLPLESGGPDEPYTSVGNLVTFEWHLDGGAIPEGPSEAPFTPYVGDGKVFTYSGETWLRLLTWRKAVPVRGNSFLRIREVYLGTGPDTLHPSVSNVLHSDCTVEVAVFNHDENDKNSRRFIVAPPNYAGEPYVKRFLPDPNSAEYPVLDGGTEVGEWDKIAIRVTNTGAEVVLGSGFSIYIEAQEVGA